MNVAALIFTVIFFLLGSWALLAVYVFAPTFFQMLEVSDFFSAVMLGFFALTGGLFKFSV